MREKTMIVYPETFKFSATCVRSLDAFGVAALTVASQVGTPKP